MYISIERGCYFSALTLLFASSRLRVVFESFSRLTAVGLGGDSVYIWGGGRGHGEKSPIFRYCGFGGKAVPLQPKKEPLYLTILQFTILQFTILQFTILQITILQITILQLSTLNCQF